MKKSQIKKTTRKAVVKTKKVISISGIDWYKKSENRDKVKQIVEAINKLDNSERYRFGAFDYNGRYFVYENEPYLLNTVDKYKEWKTDDSYYAEAITFEGYYDDWKETCVLIDDLKKLAGEDAALSWYKNHTEITESLIKILTKAWNNPKNPIDDTYKWGAFDENAIFYVYKRKPIPSQDGMGEWLSVGDPADSEYVHHVDGRINNWDETLVKLDDLIKLKSDLKKSDSVVVSKTNPTKKLVLEIKEFSDGQCKYLVKESFGIPEDDTSGCPLGIGAVGYIWTASSKQDLIDDAQKLFTEKRDTLKWGEECEVSEDKEMWTTRMLVGKHPIYEGYIVVHDLGLTDQPEYWRYARPTVKKVEPKIEGDIYTWEE